jgi:mycothiol synthase
MTITARAYDLSTDADWWAIRDLLLRTHATTPVAWNWDIRRWDGSRFHNVEPELPAVMAERIGLWEEDGCLVAAVHWEGGPGEAYLELDPAHRHLERQLVEWAEASLAVVDGDRRALEITVMDHDQPRRELLRARGYDELDRGVWIRRLALDGTAPPPPAMAAGYRMRTTTPGSLDADAAHMAALLNAAFGRTIHRAAEYRTFATRSPSFRHDLNLVAEAPDGSFAAHVGLTLDQANAHGIIEPVCTHPDHRRRGLAAALLLEGLHRLRDLGARTASVDTGDMGPANAFYRSMPFTGEVRGHTWRRDLGSVAHP